jgi:hypothetical protein
MWNLMLSTTRILCTYITHDQMASFLVLIFINWHSGWISRMAANIGCWQGICTCSPKRQHQCMDWKQWIISRVLNISNGFWTQLLSLQRIFWMSHFLPIKHGFIYLVTSTAKRALFDHQLIHTRSRIHHYINRRLVCGAPYHKIG